MRLRAVTADVLGWGDPRTRLQKALDEDHFLLYAQRIQALKPDPADRPFCEILVRLQEEEDHMLPPGEFFTVAEELGMLQDIDRWVVAHTIAWCTRIEVRLRSPLCCLNLSADALRNPAFAGYVRALIESEGVPGSCLCFEICETDVLEHPQDVRGFINVLKPRGCSFTLDGFGSVQMSFNHLRDLPVDYLKIDSSIIQNMLHGPGELARARAISTICRKLGIRAIAGHVEKPEIFAKLVEIGFDYAQGFGIGLPAPIEGFLKA